MIFGRDIELVQDTRGRKLLHLKKENTFYAMEKRQETYANLFKNNIINAVSLGVMIGYFIRLPYWAWAAIAVVVYVTYLITFNKKIFPGYRRLEEKKAIKITPPTESESKVRAFSLAFIAVGLLLMLCVPMGWSDGSIPDGVVIACGIFAVIMGIGYMNSNKKSK